MTQLIFAVAMSGVSKKAPDALVVLCRDRRRHLQHVVTLGAEPSQAVGVDQAGTRRTAAVFPASMPGRPQIKDGGALGHHCLFAVRNLWYVPAPEQSMTADGNPGRAVLRREVG